MKTIKFQKHAVQEIATCIREGGLVAIMTDTVYGLAASSADKALYAKLQVAKERPETKPFPLMVSSYAQIEALADLTPLQRHLMHTFMPGAVTFVFERREGVFDFLGDQKTLGIRMADDAWVCGIIEAVGHPIWLPSANVSGQATATSSDMVLAQLEGRIEGVVLGDIDGGTSSSVFDLTHSEIVCLRKGPVALEAIKKEACFMKQIVMASDQGGYEQKEALKAVVVSLGYDVVDYGVDSPDSMDYPDVIYPAAKAVAMGEFEKGIILCGTGIGASIVANKVKGIRAALVTSTEVATLTREHNDSNILVMAGRTTPLEVNTEIVRTWLQTEYSHDARHTRRIEKISDVETKEGRE